MRRAWLGTVATNALILVSGMATGILTARLLGPADRGLLAAVMFWPQTLWAVASLSLSEAVIARFAHRTIGVSPFIATALAASLALALLTAAAGWLLLPLVLGQARNASYGTAIAYAAAFAPLAAIASVLLSVDQAEQRFSRVNFIRLGPSWIYLLGIGVLWLAGAVSAESLLWASWVGSALTVAARLAIRSDQLLARPDSTEMRALFGLGARFHAQALLFMLASQADRIILFIAFPDRAIGLYVVAATFAQSGLAVVTSAVSFVLFPVLAGEPDRSRARRLLGRWLGYTALFLYLGVAASIAVTPWLVPLLFGPEFADAVSIAILLLAAVAPLTLRQTIVRCLRAFGEARIGVLSEAATLLGFALLAAPLTLAFGPAGLAAATIASNAAGLAVCVRHLRARHQIEPRDWLVPSVPMIQDALKTALRLVTPVVAR